MRSLLAIAFVLAAVPAKAESVDVKYRGSVDLKPFVCHDITRSSFIHRVCYDEKERYMIVLLDKTYYHYCEIDRAVVSGFEGAMSMGRFYNDHIKGSGSDGLFDCRTHRMPDYGG